MTRQVTVLKDPTSEKRGGASIGAALADDSCDDNIQGSKPDWKTESSADVLYILCVILYIFLDISLGAIGQYKQFGKNSQCISKESQLRCAR